MSVSWDNLVYSTWFVGVLVAVSCAPLFAVVLAWEGQGSYLVLHRCCLTGPKIKFSDVEVPLLNAQWLHWGETSPPI